MITKRFLLFGVWSMISFLSFGQNFTSYHTGSTADAVTVPGGGICLMGGAAEDDNAMKWFLQRANGGDVLVLRTSGSDGYNSYLYSDLGISVNSVETIVFHNASASNDPYVLQKIQQAEAIWFAGGNQWSYVSYWRDTPVENAINQAIRQRNVVIGGTSAGMAIQGKYYFTAQNGTVTSVTALSNPFDSSVNVDSVQFLENSLLDNVITDTHFDNPDRKGRLTVFLARIATDYGTFARAIACDEYTAVCIDTNGLAHVFGGYPNYDDNAYFIQVNCEIPSPMPENCTSGSPLTWNLGNLAIKAYQIKGDSTGNQTFDLNSWQFGSGGTWFNWYVINGNFYEQGGNAPNCSPTTSFLSSQNSIFSIFPNPTNHKLTIQKNDFLAFPAETHLTLLDVYGKKMIFTSPILENSYTLDLKDLHNGIYFLLIEVRKGVRFFQKIIKE